MQIYSPIAQDSLVVSGSMNVSGSVTAQSFIGNFSGTASYATNALTSSYALTASVALNVPATASYAIVALTASYANFAAIATSASFATNAAFASQASNATSASFATNASTAASASFATNASTAASASYALSASYATASAFANNSTSASYALSASYSLGTSTAISASFATVAANASSASYALNASSAASASYSVSASYAMSASYATASSFATTASYAVFAATATTASFATNASTAASASFATNAGTAGSASYAVSASYATASSFASSASYALNASNAVTASHALNSVTASYALFSANSTSASYALSSSYAFNSSVAISSSYATNAGFAGSASYAQQANTASSADNFTVRGTLTAQTLVVQTITSSVSLITGSTVFGQLGTNTHQFTGSLRVSGSGNHWILGGNVGVGTTSPTRKLHVNGDATFATDSGGLIIASYDGDTANIRPSAANGSILITDDSGLLTRGTEFLNGGGIVVQSFSGFNPLEVKSNSLTLLFVSASGNIGIGTLSPTDKLHVEGGRISVTSGGINGLSLIASGSGGRGGIIQTKAGSDWNNAMYINSNGSVGVGADAGAPQNALEIRRDQNSYTRALINNNNAGGGTGLSLMRGAGTYAFFEYDNTADTLKIQNQNNGNYGVLSLNTAGGNVGVGTTTATAKLHINYGGDDIAGFRMQGDATDNTLEFRTNNNIAHIQAYTASAYTTGSSLAINALGGNVGIGTTTPDAPLNIYGTTERAYLNVNAIAGFAGIGSGSGAMVYFNNRGDGNNILIRTNNSSRNDAAPFAVWTENNSRFIILNNGNIGIGNSSPDEKLRVSGKIKADAIYVYDGLTTGQTGIGASSSGGDLRLYSNGSIGAVLTTNGCVGVGTTVPYSRLDVYSLGDTGAYNALTLRAGNNYFSSGSNQIIFGYNGGANNYAHAIKTRHMSATAAGNNIDFYLWNYGTDAQTTVGTKLVMTIEGSGNVGIGTTTPQYQLDVLGNVMTRFFTSGNPSVYIYENGAGSNGGTVDLYDRATGTVVTRLAGAPGLHSYFNNNASVGIGTSSPPSKLTVSNAGAEGIEFKPADSTGISRILFYNRNDSTRDDAQYDALTHQFQVNTGIEAMRIAVDGNIGIGTTTVNTKLHIFSNADSYRAIRIQASASTGDAGIEFIGAGGNIFNIQQPGSSAGLFFYDRTNTTTRMTIDGNGNIGINNTSPGSYLDVVDSDGGQQMLRVRNYAVGATGNFTGHYMVELRSAWTTGAASGSLLVHTQEADDTRKVMAVSDANGIFTTFVNGKVGIGSTTPAYKLDIAGAVRITNTSGSGNFLRIKSTTSNYGGQVDFYESDTLSHAIISTGANNTFYIRDEYNAATRLLINNTGNVGINTTSPQARLHVSAGGVSTPRGSGFTKFFFTGDNAITTYFEIQTPTGSTGDILFSDANGGDYGIIGYDHATDSMRIYTKSAITMFISGSGNVGIGTTAPSTYLDVRGTGDVGSSSLSVRSGNGSGNFSSNQIVFGYNNTTSYRHAIKTRHHDSDYINAFDFYVWKYGTDTAETIGTQHIMTLVQGGVGSADTGRVGIGTTSPTTKLHVVGQESRFGGVASGFISIYSATGRSGYIQANGGTDLRIASDTDPMTLYVNGSERMRITANGDYNYGPSNPQHSSNSVYRQAFWGAMSFLWRNAEDAYINSNHTYSSTNTNVASYTSANGIGRLGIAGGILEWGTYDGSVSAGTAYSLSTKLIVTRAGNVGIGTTSFGTARLSVDGNMGFAGDTTKYLYMPDVNQGTGSIYMQAGFGSAQAGGAIRLHGHNATAYTGGDVEVGLSGKGNFLINSTIGGSRLVTVNINGNVGIGTTAPGYKLQVYNSANGTTAAFGGTSRGIRIDNDGTFSSGRSTIYGVDATFYGSYQPLAIGASTLYFSISGTDRMTIDSSGNVGIGSTSPSATLDVSGSLIGMTVPTTATLPTAIPFTINAVGTARNMTGNAGSYSFGDNTMLTLIAGDETQTHLGLWRASSTATGSVGGSRLVGFGSRGTMTLPVSVGDDDVIFSLEGWAIHGAGPNKAKFGAGMRFVKDDDFGTASTYAPQRTEFYNANSTTTVQTNMTILPNGNVGINVSNPVTKLDVYGVGDTSGVAPLCLRGGNSSDTFTGNQIRLSYNATSDYSHAIKTRHHSGNYLNAIDFYVWKYATDATGTIGTQHVMTLTQGIDGINGNGRVGIGTAYPAYKLDVSGDIRATADVIAYSDARVKTNVKTIEAPLDLVTKLRGVTYNRTDIDDKSEKVGVIAQEVLEVLPQVVAQDHEGNYSVAYGNIVGVLIEAIKELKAEIDELKSQK